MVSIEEMTVILTKIVHMSLKSIASVFILALAMASCKDKDPEPVEVKKATVELKLDTKWQNGDFNLGEVYYDDFTNRIRLDNFMSYFSFMTLTKDDGTEVVIKDFILADLASNTTISAEIEPGTYTGFKMGIGIPVDYNTHVDPATYPSSSPLSVAGSQGMFWHWNTGYIFVKFEGKVDTSATEGVDLLNSFSFHVGDDQNFRQFTSNNENFVMKAGETTSIGINIHIDQILASGGNDSIDLATDAVTHTSGNPNLAQVFIDNMKNCITVD
jgi:hypothetical protein